MRKRILVFGKKSRFLVSGNMEVELGGKKPDKEIDVSSANKQEWKELIGNLSNEKLIKKIQEKELTQLK